MTVFLPQIPKVIYSLWLQGAGDAPPLPKLNFDRWQALNPRYRFEVLELKDVRSLLACENIPVSAMSPQALSDVLRARLLSDRGGIWVDASLFPVKPLDEWLPSVLTESGFFAFDRPGPDRLISSWFLVATPQNQLLRRWWAETKRFWQIPRRPMPEMPRDWVRAVSPEGAGASDEYPYFWFHYLFQYVVENDGYARELWDKSVKISADLPHRMQFMFAANKDATEADIRNAADAAPVQKLNWRVPYPLDMLATL